VQTNAHIPWVCIFNWLYLSRTSPSRLLFIFILFTSLHFFLYFIQKPQKQQNNKSDTNNNSSSIKDLKASESIEDNKNPAYETQRKATLMEISRSNHLLNSYQQRLEKERLDQEDEERQSIIIRKIYRQKVEGDDAANTSGVDVDEARAVDDGDTMMDKQLKVGDIVGKKKIEEPFEEAEETETRK